MVFFYPFVGCSIYKLNKSTNQIGSPFLLMRTKQYINGYLALLKINKSKMLLLDFNFLTNHDAKTISIA